LVPWILFYCEDEDEEKRLATHLLGGGIPEGGESLTLLVFRLSL
jgi:hypothetical protein